MNEAAKGGSAGTVRKLGAAALLLGGSQLLSRLLGVVREAVLADRIGAGAATDAYQAAFAIPDILNSFLAVGAISVAFIPLYRRALAEGGAPAGEHLLRTVLGSLTALVVLSSVLLWLLADPLIALQFPRFDPATHALTVRLTRIVLPAQIFFVSGGILRAVLMAQGRFFAQALAPLVYNLGIIAGGLLGSRALGVEGFAWGALVGAAAGPLGAALLEARGRVALSLRVAPLDADFRRYLLVVLPLLAGVTLVTVDEWYARWFAQLAGTGAIAVLFFARRLMQAPVGLVGTAVGTAALPALSELFSQGRLAELDRLLLWTLRATLSLAVIVAAGMAALATPLVQLVYQRGAFTAEDGAAVSMALVVFCMGIPGWVVQAVAVRAFYARGDTWRPMLLGTGIALLAIPAYLGLAPRAGVPGLAAAGAGAISLNALATLLLARRLHGAPSMAAIAGSLLRALGIALPAALAAHWAAAGLGGPPLAQLARGSACLALVAVPLAWWLGDDALRDLLRRLARRLKRTPQAGSTRS